MSSRSWRRGLALAAMLTCLAWLPAVAKPALWVVRSATATIYLFGTVHALPPDLDWRSPTLDHAFKESKALWLELAHGSDPSVIRPAVEKLGTDFTHPLSNKLTPTQLLKLDAALRRAGKRDGRAGLEWLRPWAVAQFVGGGPDGGLILDRGAGADNTLLEDAVESDKPVFGLETPEQQLRVFADLSRDQESDLLDEALNNKDDPAAALKSLIDAWMAGKVDTLATLTRNHDGPISETIYTRLLVDRNRNWVTKIAELLQGHGTIFLAGGAGHFAGPDSVLAQLAAQGIKAQRLQ